MVDFSNRNANYTHKSRHESKKLKKSKISAPQQYTREKIFYLNALHDHNEAESDMYAVTADSKDDSQLSTSKLLNIYFNMTLLLAWK